VVKITEQERLARKQVRDNPINKRVRNTKRWANFVAAVAIFLVTLAIGAIINLILTFK
jgi:hypothetical protein